MSEMKHSGLKLMAIFAIGTGSVATPAHAVPPVAQSSPGYESRLQEGRKAATKTVKPTQPEKQKRKAPPQ